MMETDRGVQNQANANARTATATAGGYGSTAGGIGATLIPGMTQEYTNPTGMSPTDLNNELVAGEQAAGGATGALTDAGELAAERTRNTGNLASTLDQVARRGGQQLSQNTLDVLNRNAALKERQKEQAQSGLESLYGTDVGAQLKGMGIANEDLDTALKAGQTGWLQNTMGTLGTLSGMGLGAAKAAGFG